MQIKNFCYVYHNLSYSKRIKIHIKLIILMHSSSEWLTHILDIIKLRSIKIDITEVWIAMKCIFSPQYSQSMTFQDHGLLNFRKKRLQEIT